MEKKMSKSRTDENPPALPREIGPALTTAFGALVFIAGSLAGSSFFFFAGLFLATAGGCLLALKSDYSSGGKIQPGKDDNDLTMLIDPGTFDNISFDAEGAVMQKRPRPAGQVYNPEIIALYALYKLRQSEKNPDALPEFWKQVVWIEKNAQTKKQGTAAWPCDYEFKDHGMEIPVGTISLEGHAACILALVEAYQLDPSDSTFKIIKGALKTLQVYLKDGGLLGWFRGEEFLNAYSIPEMVPRLKSCLLTVLVLYRINLGKNLPDTSGLLKKLLKGIRVNIEYFDCARAWSRTARLASLPDVREHRRTQWMLEKIAEKSGDGVLKIFAKRWRPGMLDPFSAFYVAGFRFSRKMADIVRHLRPEWEKWTA